jgi:hypothetical protein
VLGIATEASPLTTSKTCRYFGVTIARSSKHGKGGILTKHREGLMPSVPNYEPTPKPPPNEKELARLRKIKADREARKKRQKRERWLETYWLNNPAYFERQDDVHG